jgi:acyl-CoA-binding protein
MSEVKELLDDLFEEHVQKIKTYHEHHKMSNGDMLELYGLYKQSISGDNDNTHSSFRSLKERKMSESWENFKGLNSNYTKQCFINRVNQIILKKN